MSSVQQEPVVQTRHHVRTKRTTISAAQRIMLIDFMREHRSKYELESCVALAKTLEEHFKFGVSAGIVYGLRSLLKWPRLRAESAPTLRPDVASTPRVVMARKLPRWIKDYCKRQTAAIRLLYEAVGKLCETLGEPREKYLGSDKLVELLTLPKELTMEDPEAT